MISNEFRLSHCRLCRNRKLNPKYGVVCGLDPLPEFKEDRCPAFNPDHTEAEYLSRIRHEAVAEEEKEKEAWVAKIYWNILLTGIPIIIGLITLNKFEERNINYRWTLGTTYEISQEFSFQSPFREIKYRHFRYRVNGELYDTKSEVDFDIVDAKADHHNYFVQFETSNPGNARIIDFKMAPYYLTPEDFPENGVSKDSLKVFIKGKMEERKRSWWR